MNKLNFLIIALGLVLVLFAINSQAMIMQVPEPRIQLIPESNNVSLEAGNSINVLLNIVNNGSSKQCVELYTKTYSNKLEAELASTSVCVSPNQTVSFSLSIFSEIDAVEKNYLVEVFAEQGTKQLTKTSIDVDVYKTNTFEVNQKNSIDVFYKTGYTKFVKVIVTNLTSKFQKISLTSDSELFVPTINPNIVHLDAFESKEVELQININNTTPTGVFEIPIYAKSSVNNRIIERSVLFELKDASELHEKKFDLEVLDKYTLMNRKENKFVKFKVTNLLSEEQKIRFMLNNGGLDAELIQSSVVLKAGESEIFEIKINGQDYYEDKEFQGIIWAYNDKEQLKDSFIVRIESDHNVVAELLNNDLEQKICSINGKEFFEIKITNYGDFDETINLDFDNSYENIQVVASKNNFELKKGTIKKGTSKIVRIIVNPGFNTSLGEKKINVTINTNNKTINSFELKFTVIPIESSELEFGVIEFVSTPKKIIINQGEEKTIQVSITNTSDETVQGLIELSLKGQGYGVTSETEKVYTLIPGETKKIPMKIIVEKNAKLVTINAIIEAKHEKYIAIMPIELNIVKSKTSEEKQENNILAGLFNLSNNLSIGKGIIVLIVLLTIILLISLLSSEEKTSEFEVYRDRRGMYA